MTTTEPAEGTPEQEPLGASGVSVGGMPSAAAAESPSSATTEPAEETPEPQPGADGGTPPESASESGTTGGDPPATPAAESPPQNSAASESPPRESLRAITAEVLGVAPGASRRKKVIWLLVTAAAALLGVAGVVVRDYLLIKPSVSRENESNKAYDAAQQPFTVSVQPDKGDPGQPWVMLLDRDLTPAETRKLTAGDDPSSAFAYLRTLSGRPLSFPSEMQYAPKGHVQQSSNGHLETTDTFKMTVLSTRATAVVIDGWKVTPVACRKSTVKTVVASPPQGGAVYQGIQLHIPPRADEPVLTDEGEGQGEPYFDTHYIEVGGGQASGGLRVEAIAPPGQSCEWGVTVHYVDAYQKARWVQLKDRDGKPLRVRTESIPLHPDQKWLTGSVPWTACHLKPEDPECDIL
ncbi:hypothetical protein [Streptomyces sp. NPDC049040]|uniref:hypothetical protein n=1 Tax=Streptomyces sp. NPDC049040 TaxID=3365593 RepID=UPI003718CBF1